MKRSITLALTLLIAATIAALMSCQSTPTPPPPSGAPGAARALDPALPPFRLQSGDEDKEDLTARALTSIGYNSEPVFSGDGGKVLFVSRARATHKHGQIYELDLVRMTERRLTFHDGDDGSPAWWTAHEFLYSSPTDKLKEEPAMIARLKDVYLGDSKATFSGVGDLYRQRLDGRTIERLTQSPGLDHHVTRDPASQRLVFARLNGGQSKLFAFQNGQVRQLSPKETNDTEPGFSLDGKKLAFVRIIDDKHSQIFLANGLDVKTARALTDDQSINKNPAWHPSGEAIIFSSNRDGKTFDLYMFDLKQNCLIRLTTSPSSLHGPAFSPDGKALVFAVEDSGTQQIHIMDFESSAKCMETKN